jgi:hypothetical protein
MTQNESGQDLRAATNRIMAIMQSHKGELLAKPNVVGVAVGFRQVKGRSTDTLALVVMVDHKIPQNLLRIDVQEIGEISAQ